jgi:hypothetical protein
MKSRAITLGASVIALTLAGGASQARADVFGSAGLQVPDTGVAPKVEANVKVNVKTNGNTPTASLQGSLQADTRGSKPPPTTVETKHRTGKQQSHVVLESDSESLSAYADQRRKGKFGLEAAGHAGPRHAESTVTGFSRRGGKASVHGNVRTETRKRTRAQSHRRAARTGSVDFPLGHKKPLMSLQGIGRAVGNPTQLIHAGWLIVLTAAGCLGLPSLVRRLNGTS